jgi:hypothetical protein
VAKHGALVDAGWRCTLDGSWRSPDPNDRRRVYTFRDAWRCFIEHVCTEPDVSQQPQPERN